MLINEDLVLQCNSNFDTKSVVKISHKDSIERSREDSKKNMHIYIYHGKHMFALFPTRAGKLIDGFSTEKKKLIYVILSC